LAKLDPRPITPPAKYSWDTLNNTLQAGFKTPGKKSVVIDLRNYDLTKEEIVTEAESQGYKVSEESEFYLRFE
jgi:hypothetical protein